MSTFKHKDWWCMCVREWSSKVGSSEMDEDISSRRCLPNRVTSASSKQRVSVSKQLSAVISSEKMLYLGFSIVC